MSTSRLGKVPSLGGMVHAVSPPRKSWISRLSVPVAERCADIPIQSWWSPLSRARRPCSRSSPANCIASMESFVYFLRFCAYRTPSLDKQGVLGSESPNHKCQRLEEPSRTSSGRSVAVREAAPSLNWTALHPPIMQFAGYILTARIIDNDRRRF